jgi:CheY-like chemotaxis protein
MRVLIADFDRARSRAVAEACQAQGFAVDRARHGAAALETALDRVPSAVVCPIDLPVIDAVRLAEILRGNPRLRHASFVFLVKDELDAPMAMDPRDSVVVSPWLIEDVIANINAVAERSERFGDGKPESEIEGKLSQISVVDLLQMFQMNQRTGTIRIFRTGSHGGGTVLVRNGQVSDAWIPLADGSNVCGEKALYRLLSWHEGRFEFVPEAVSDGGRITQPTRALLLEGMRQIDEWQKLSGDLPERETRLSLVVARDRIPNHDHPLTRDVLDAVEAYRRVGEVVDHCAFPDYQVLRVLYDLLARQALVHEATHPAAEGVSTGEGVFSSAQLRRLREWAASLGPRQSAVVKILVVAANRGAMVAFHRALRSCGDFMSEPRLVSEPERIGGLGTLGHFVLGEGLNARVIGVPAGPKHAPLWDVAAYGALGAVILPTDAYGPGLEETEAAFQRLQDLDTRAIVHVIVADEETGSDDPDGDDTLGELAGGGVFVLPSNPGEEQIAVLRNLFARLVP